MPNLEPLLVSTALLQRAEEVCRKRLMSDPDNRSVLASMGKTCRKLGKRNEAQTAYERLTRLDPDDREAAYMHAILAGIDVPVVTGMRPAPFVLVKDFLPASFHETLLPFAVSIRDKLVPAKVATNDEDGVYNPERRESLDLPGEWEVKTRFREFVREIIPTLVPRLHVVPFDMCEPEVKVRAYLDGHFFRLHMDCGSGNDKIAHRKISYTYYFHKVPRAYTGGDLLLFDTDIDANRFTTSGFTSVVPDDNTLVVFPSPYFHSVLPVSCPSQQYEDSRFVINGHISSRMPMADSAVLDDDAMATSAAGT